MQKDLFYALNSQAHTIRQTGAVGYMKSTGEDERFVSAGRQRQLRHTLSCTRSAKMGTLEKELYPLAVVLVRFSIDRLGHACSPCDVQHFPMENVAGIVNMQSPSTFLHHVSKTVTAGRTICSCRWSIAPPAPSSRSSSRLRAVKPP